MAKVRAGDVRTYYLCSTTDKVTDAPDGYIIVNVLKWTGTPWINLCPYRLKTDGQETLAPPKGIIFENFWQGTKVFSSIYPQQQYASKFHQGKPEHLWFSHQLKGTMLHLDGTLDLEKYHKWRDQVWQCPKPVRYPNGHQHKSEVLYTLGPNNTQLDYLMAREEIYVKEYCRLVRNTTEFKRLVELHRKGTNILICEMDVPLKGKNGAYGKYIEKGTASGRLSVSLTSDIIAELLYDPSAPFGHGLCLAKMLIDQRDT